MAVCLVAGRPAAESGCHPVDRVDRLFGLSGDGSVADYRRNRAVSVATVIAAAIVVVGETIEALGRFAALRQQRGDLGVRRGVEIRHPHVLRRQTQTRIPGGGVGRGDTPACNT